MLVSCPSCGKRISDRAPACPFCKTPSNAAPPAESAPPKAPVESAPPPVPEENAPTLPPVPDVSTPAPLIFPEVSTPPKTVPLPSAPPPPVAYVKPYPPTYDPSATLPPGPLPAALLASLARHSPTAVPVQTPSPPPEEPQPSPAPAPVQTEPPPSEEPEPSALSDGDRVVFLEAVEHFGAGRFEDALATVDQLLSTQPRHGEALSTRAQALFKLGRREEAARSIVKAIEASPDSLPLWHAKTVMEQEEGKGKQAWRSAMDFVEIGLHNEVDSPLVEQGRLLIASFEEKGGFPNSRGYLGWLGLGCVSMKAGRAEAALEFFDRAIDAASGNAAGFRWKGRALAQLEQADEALVLLDVALEVDPNDPETHHDRGIVFAMLGDTERAVEAFDVALALDPYHAPSRAEKRKYAG